MPGNADGVYELKRVKQIEEYRVTMLPVPRQFRGGEERQLAAQLTLAI